MSLAATDILMPEFGASSTATSRRTEVSISDTVDRGQLVWRILTAQFLAKDEEKVSESAVPTIHDSADTAQIESAIAEALAEIDRYEGYGRRWDGYFAEPFDEVVLEQARRIVLLARDMLIKEQIVPSLLTTGPASDGSLDIEIRRATKTLFYTVYPEADIEISANDQGKQPTRRIVPFESMAMAQWLGWLAGKENLPLEMENNRPHSG
jgi:hypothetical protein